MRATRETKHWIAQYKLQCNHYVTCGCNHHVRTKAWCWVCDQWSEVMEFVRIAL